MVDGVAPLDKLQFLTQLKSVDLTEQAQQAIRAGGKAGRQDSHKQALTELCLSFEEHFLEAVTAAFDLFPAQVKKMRYKKDRVRIFKAHGIDYMDIDGADTAQVLAQIAQAIHYDDAIVTADLHNIFPFWKEGFPMVQFDNAYKILSEDITIHYQTMLDTLIASIK
ncbi:hypothetical protein [Acinetobacter sp. MD2(2019)]|uniref:hypothetical protein n=1 Tax=Acinetobacter sp. MD2(2019) TaxID=2605273 RepID=UPI002D1F19A7|nr:hypothetical protein [Acinetobacter sp. MD2(2019)]MEB3753845.1 hypothetical protein [Acinetobacter sp. MD2(2019)]